MKKRSQAMPDRVEAVAPETGKVANDSNKAAARRRP